MQIYLVGGAVRDQLLGRPIKDKDYVVVGATVAQMLSAGFVQVGADFPVFLHPKTHEEYALARTERKQGVGYQGFSIHASIDVTLQEDLQRRDLTINAMAIEVTSLTDDTPLTEDARKRLATDANEILRWFYDVAVIHIQQTDYSKQSQNHKTGKQKPQTQTNAWQNESWSDNRRTENGWSATWGQHSWAGACWRSDKSNWSK